MTPVNVPLGRLERVDDIRSVWPNEASDFTPWLAMDENIALLGDAISIDLEVEAQEKGVGPFRADLLCKDTANGQWVLIENQLDRTDHAHLGQLMTYAAGLNAVTIVWIANPFTDEHRAALDWLNDITDDTFNFFGLQVELLRIGDSPIAPKFNIVSKPNDWTKTVSRVTSHLQSSDVTKLQELRLEYWTGFCEVMRDRGGLISPRKPVRDYWMNFAIGRTHFWLEARANSRDGWIETLLCLGGENAKAHFFLLLEEKLSLESSFGEDLDWRELPEKGQSKISMRLDHCDLKNKEDWPRQHEWFYEKLQKFHKVFSNRVKTLDAADWDSREEH